jgi:long-subunit fatty acid transport protein
MKRLSTVAAVVTLIAINGHALAQGYYAGTQGARAAGRAGAFTARADDLSAIELNPAGLADIGKTVIQVGNRFSYNTYDFTRQSTLDWGHADTNTGVAPNVQFATVRNGKPAQYLDPIFGIASNLGLKDWGFALAAYAPAGVAREQYPADGGQRYMMVNRDSQIINYTASVAWKLREVFGLGATFQWIAVPSLKYELMVNGNPFTRNQSNGEQPVYGKYDAHTTISGKDMFTPNAIIGAWYRPAPYLQWGLSAQVIPTAMNIKAKLGVQPLHLGDATLIRDKKIADDVTLALPLPIKLREGVRYRYLRGGREIFDIELDVAYEFWSRVRTFTLESNGIDAIVDGQRIPIGRIDIQKHWKNTVTIALGGDYAVIPDALTVRGGTFYISALADPAYTQVDFVSGKQLGGTLGLSIFAGNLEVALAYEYRHMLPVSLSESDSRVYQTAPATWCKPPYTTASGCNTHYTGMPSPVVNAGSYHANSQVAALDLLYRF